jgi:hypothetical protein
MLGDFDAIGKAKQDNVHGESVPLSAIGAADLSYL